MQLIGILKPGSRLRWLLSETLVVVLGVLIALGLNDFWTSRHERDLELQYLTRIHSDVNADIVYIDQSFRIRLEMKLQALDTIAPVVRGTKPVPDDVETFLKNVALGGLLGASTSKWITDTTFEDLKSTGNLRLIRDPELRWKISRYYYTQEILFQRASDRQTEYVMNVHSLLPAELRDDMDFASMENLGVDRALERVLSPKFQDLMNQEFNYAMFLHSLDYVSTSKQLIQDLENQLRHFDDTD